MSVVATSGSARRGSRWLLLALAALASPFLLFLIVRTTILGLSPSAAATLPPADEAPLLRRMIPGLADPRVRVPAQVVAMAERSAATSPLTYEPYFVFARKASGEGDLRRAILLMEEARRRRPNYLPTRLLLMAYYSQASRYPEAIREMEYSLRSSEDVRRVVLPELVKAIRNPLGRRALADVLARGPDWHGEFFGAAQNETIRPEQARELMELIRAKRPKGDLAAERGLYLQALVKSGQAGQARAVWLQDYPEAERARHQHLFDGAFTGRTAPQPFGWTLHDLDAGRAEIIRPDAQTSHLEVNYFGGKTVIVAEQMLALAAGSYQLSFAARSDTGIRSGELYWVLYCEPEGPELTKARILAAQPAYRRYQAEVRVPASACPSQRLRLIADPGDVSAAFTVQIDDMRVVRR